MQEPSTSSDSQAVEHQINSLADEFLTLWAADPGEAQAQFAASVLSMLGTLVQAQERLLELQMAQLAEMQALRLMVQGQSGPPG